MSKHWRLTLLLCMGHLILWPSLCFLGFDLSLIRLSDVVISCVLTTLMLSTNGVFNDD